MIEFIEPDINRDAPYAFSWFDRPEGRSTLLSMGNAENEIAPTTIEGEKETLRSFIQLEAEGTQTTRMISADGRTIGAVWVEWTENHNVLPPSIHVMVGDPDFRGKGIGTLALRYALNLIEDKEHNSTVYSRHLVSNLAIAKILSQLGFHPDGDPYVDDNNLQWQNVIKPSAAKELVQ